MLEHRRLRPARSRDRGHIHAWVGEAAASAGAPMSLYSVTDDERVLRDLAFPLIESPYDRHRWAAVVYEYGTKRELWANGTTAYYRHDDICKVVASRSGFASKAETALTQLQQQISANQVGDRRRRSSRFGR
jgi:hypothetical protein